MKEKDETMENGLRGPNIRLNEESRPKEWREWWRGNS